MTDRLTTQPPDLEALIPNEQRREVVARLVEALRNHEIVKEIRLVSWLRIKEDGDVETVPGIAVVVRPVGQMTVEHTRWHVASILYGLTLNEAIKNALGPTVIAQHRVLATLGYRTSQGHYKADFKEPMPVVWQRPTPSE